VRVGDILRTARFWCFAAAFFFTPVSNFMVTTHQVAHIVEAGIDPRWAATAFGVMGLLSAVGRAGFGALSDRTAASRLRPAATPPPCSGSCVLLVRPGSPHWLIYAFIALFGLTLGACGRSWRRWRPILLGRTPARCWGAAGNRLGSRSPPARRASTT
jgi:hypothetical protein